MTFADGRVLASAIVFDTGHGGAVYSAGALTLVVADGGEAVFHNNQANAGNDNSAASYASGRGGAIFANTTLTMNSGAYTFNQNQANAGNDNSAASYSSGWGGAIFAYSTLTMNSGAYTFSQNQANAGNDNGGSSNNSGRGGAIYAYSTLTMNSGAYTFSQNQANAGNENSGNSHNSGRGGAIFAGNTLTMNSGDYTFSQNQANAGNENSANSSNSGLGGAIYANSTLTMEGGAYTFSQNQANAGNENSDNSFWSGMGGAIYANSTLTMDGGVYTFVENSASDGVGNSGNNDASGLGGAIYVSNDFSLTDADAVFINNRAVNQSGNATSGRGGAIFHDAYDNYAFDLGASNGKTILFQGNTQGTGEANSIYFGNTRTSNRTITAIFDAVGSGRIVMYDPMESQEDGLARSAGGTYGNVTVTMTKIGSGMWSLGGVSNFKGAASLTLTEGIFHQMDEYSQLNLAHTTTATFTANAGSIYRPTVNGSSGLNSEIVANAATVNAGAQFQVGGAATLTPGRQYSFTVIETNDNTASNNFTSATSDLLNAALARDGDNYVLTVTAGAMPSSIGFSDNAIDSFFRTGGYLGNLDVADFVDDIYNNGYANIDKRQVADANLLAGDFAANLSVMSVQAARAFVDAAWGRFATFEQIRAYYQSDAGVASSGALANPVAAFASDRRNRVWASGLGSWASMDDDRNMQGYDSRVLGAALGYDFAFTDCFAAGAYAGYARLKSENDRDSARLDADHYYLGLYANYDKDNIVANAGAYFGWSDNDTEHRYRAYGVKTTGDYDGLHYGAKFDIGYRFRPACAFDLTPFAGVEWYHTRNDGYTERQRGTTVVGSNFARRLGKENFDSLQIPVGVRFGKTFAIDNGSWVRLGGSVAYAREIADRNGKVSASLLNHNTAWTARGTEAGRDIFRAAASVSALFRERYEAAVEYNLEVRENYHDNRVKVSIGVRF